MNVGIMALQALKTIGIGIGVVFAVLAIIYALIRIMTKVWAEKD